MLSFEDAVCFFVLRCPGVYFFKFHFLECNTEQYLDMVVVVDDFSSECVR